MGLILIPFIGNAAEHMTAVTVAFKPLIELWSRPWFSRLWIIHESTMATSAVVVIGPYEQDWADFGVAARFFSCKGYSGPVHRMAELLESVPWTMGFVAHYIATREHHTASASLLLLMTRRAQATDPRDKVYSLLGLADEEEEKAFKANYTKTEQDLFTDVARHFLCCPNPRVEHHLALLASVKHYNDDPTAEWPSWVPRWHNRMPGTKYSAVPNSLKSLS